MTAGTRRIPVGTYVFFYTAFALVLLLAHTPFLKLPYFWDELGQFIPAALDLYQSGAWIPHSTAPNVHPPAVVAFLAGAWSIAGYSIASTRVAMLLVAAAALLAAFLLAIRLAANLPGRPAFTVVVLLAISPLYYSQSMMALLDLPAMLFTCLALLLFLQQRTVAAAVACLALVMVKETGAIVPAVLGAWLAGERRWREAAWFLPAFAALGGWVLVLKSHTGNFLGNDQFARQNLLYLFHPVRLPIAVLRRLYFLFAGDFHWIGTLAIAWALRRAAVFRIREWRVAGSIVAAHVLVFSLFGYAMLERYLLPVLPILYSAMVAGFTTLPRGWKRIAPGALAAGLVACNFWNPPYPFPMEDNAAFIDFVRLQQEAADFVQFRYPRQTVLTAWPLSSALGRSEYGYVERRIRTEQIADFRPVTLGQVDWSKVGVFVMYSRNWDPEWNLLHIGGIRRLWERYYGYQPDLDVPESGPALERVAHWERRGQWIDVYAVTGGGGKPYFLVKGASPAAPY